MLDIDGADWMINKFHEIDTLVSAKLTMYSSTLSLNELQRFRIEKFSLQLFIIEVKGRNGRFDECREIMENQCKLLTKLAPGTLKKCPFVTLMHLEPSVLLHSAYRENSDLQIRQKYLTSTPEAVMRLAHMSLNPSGKVLLADKNSPL